MNKIIAVKIFSKDSDHFAYPCTAVIEDILADHFGAIGVETFAPLRIPYSNRFATIYGMCGDTEYYTVKRRFEIMRELLDAARYFDPGCSIEVDINPNDDLQLKCVK